MLKHLNKQYQNVKMILRLFLVVALSLPTHLFGQSEGATSTSFTREEPDGGTRSATRSEVAADRLSSISSGLDAITAEIASQSNGELRANKTNCPLGAQGSTYDYAKINSDLVNAMFSAADTQGKKMDDNTCSQFASTSATSLESIQDSLAGDLGELLNVGETDDTTVETEEAASMSYNDATIACEYFSVYFEADLEKVSEQIALDVSSYDIPISNPVSSSSKYGTCYETLNSSLESTLSSINTMTDASGETVTNSFSIYEDLIDSINTAIASATDSTVSATLSAGLLEINTAVSAFYLCIEQAQTDYLYDYGMNCLAAEELAAIEQQYADEANEKQAVIDAANAEIEQRNAGITSATSGVISQLSSFITNFNANAYGCPGAKAALTSATSLLSSLSFLMPNALVGAGMGIVNDVMTTILSSDVMISPTKMDEAVAQFMNESTQDALFSANACRIHSMFKKYCDIGKEQVRINDLLASECLPKEILKQSPFTMLADLNDAISSVLSSPNKLTSMDALLPKLKEHLASKDPPEYPKYLSSPYVDMCGTPGFSQTLNELSPPLKTANILECSVANPESMETSSRVKIPRVAGKISDEISSLEALLKTQEGGTLLGPDESLQDLFNNIVSNPSFSDYNDLDTILSKDFGGTPGKDIMNSFFSSMQEYKLDKKSSAKAEKMMQDYGKFQHLMQTLTKDVDLGFDAQDPISLFVGLARNVYQDEFADMKKKKKSDYYNGEGSQLAQAIDRFNPNPGIEAANELVGSYNSYLQQLGQEAQDKEVVQGDLDNFVGFLMTDLQGGKEKKNPGARSNESLSLIIEKEMKESAGKYIDQMRNTTSFWSKSDGGVTEDQKDNYLQDIFDKSWAMAQKCVLLKPYYQHPYGQTGRIDTRSFCPVENPNCRIASDKETRNRQAELNNICAPFLCESMGLSSPYYSGPTNSCDAYENINVIMKKMEANFKKNFSSEFVTSSGSGKNKKYQLKQADNYNVNVCE